MLHIPPFLELSAVVFGSYLGAGLRFLFTEAMQDLPTDGRSNDPAAAVLLLFQTQPFLISNMLGCMVIGYLSHITPHLPKLAPGADPTHLAYLLRGASVGFCGCLTTFSSWFNKYMSGTYDSYWFADLTVLGIELAITWCCLLLGLALADLHILAVDRPPMSPPLTTDDKAQGAEVDVEVVDLVPAVELGDPEGSPSAEYYQHCSNLQINLPGLVKALALVAWAMLVVLWVLVIADCVQGSVTGDDDSRNAVRVLALAPFGAMIRYFISQQPAVTDCHPTWKLQTLSVNLSGLLIAVAISNYAPDWTWSRAFLDGFLGSFTTVSTWFNELYQLYHAPSQAGQLAPQLAALRYGFVTIASAIVIAQLLRLG